MGAQTGFAQEGPSIVNVTHITPNCNIAVNVLNGPKFALMLKPWGFENDVKNG